MCAQSGIGDGRQDREPHPLTMRTENCGNCVFCISVCPFEALSQDPETKKVLLDEDKCRFCGICYGSCPSNLIDVAFFNTDHLTEFVTGAMEKTGKANLMVVCRGNTYGEREVREMVEERDAVLISLPCLGRVTVPFLLTVVENGAEQVLIIPCEDEFCRFREGSKVLQSRADNANMMLEDMGLYPDTIEILKRHDAVLVDKDLCISCGLCVSLCPYEAPTIVKDESGKRYSSIDKDKCHQCGLCVASCPQKAISIPDGPEETSDLLKAPTGQDGEEGPKAEGG